MTTTKTTKSGFEVARLLAAPAVDRDKWAFLFDEDIKSKSSKSSKSSKDNSSAQSALIQELASSFEAQGLCSFTIARTLLSCVVLCWCEVAEKRSSPASLFCGCCCRISHIGFISLSKGCQVSETAGAAPLPNLPVLLLSRFSNKACRLFH